jgi:dCMP deaminase
MKYIEVLDGLKEEPLFVNFIPPTWDELFMRDVYSISYKSKDPRSKLGAVLIDWSSKNPFARGYNDFARGVEDKIKPERWERPEKYDWVVHAESNCVLTCGREGIRTKGSVMYTQGVPCAQCADDVIQGGIVEIVVHKQWQEYEQKFNWAKWNESSAKSEQKLNEARVKVRVFDGILGVVGFLDGKVIKV